MGIQLDGRRFPCPTCPLIVRPSLGIIPDCDICDGNRVGAVSVCITLMPFFVTRAVPVFDHGSFVAYDAFMCIICIPALERFAIARFDIPAIGACEKRHNCAVQVVAVLGRIVVA